jgi:EAL domain-containing protein (putative c-di-GMP-specific phosphodiesterase class I)
MRCAIGQGYYFARPLDSDLMAELIISQPAVKNSAS